MQLSPSQIEAVLSRNTDLRLRVLEFNVLVSTLGWNQVRTRPGFLQWDVSIPGAIPAEGIYVTDSELGTVVIFPDAAGVLRFNTTNNLGSAHLIGPSGIPPLPALPSLPAITTLLILVAVAFIVFEVAPIVMLATAKRPT